MRDHNIGRRKITQILSSLKTHL